MVRSGNANFIEYDLTGSYINGLKTKLMLSYQCNARQVCRVYTVLESKGYRTYIQTNKLLLVFPYSDSYTGSVDISSLNIERIEYLDDQDRPKGFLSKFNIFCCCLYYKMLAWFRV